MINELLCLPKLAIGFDHLLLGHAIKVGQGTPLVYLVSG